MALVTVVIRPYGARTEIHNLPWSGPRGGYKVVEDAIGASRRRQVKYDPSSKFFTVSRRHTRVLIEALGARYGRVHVIQHGGTDKCVAACWKADRDTAWQCECSCAGDNHGSQHPIGPVVADSGGGAGALSVRRSVTREWDYPPR